MGASESVLPAIDKRGQKAVKLAKLVNKDLVKFLRVFQKIDKDLVGKIYVEEFFDYLGEPRSIFTDSLFELVGTPLNKGRLTFGDFLHVICTYTLFEPVDIQKFIYFIFDRDKNGYIKTDELEIYIKLINQMGFDQDFKSNLLRGWEVLRTEFNKDGRVEFKEFMVFNAEWPFMFFPAYRLQEKMVERTLGRKWWDTRRRALQDIRDRAKEKEEKKKQQEKDRLERVRWRKIRKRMGCIRYYFCPCMRDEYEKLYPPQEDEEEKKKKKEKLEEEMNAAKRKEKLEARQEEERKQRNQPTVEFVKFQKRKKEIEEQWAKDVLVPKRAFRERRVRAEGRRDRWKNKF